MVNPCRIRREFALSELDRVEWVREAIFMKLVFRYGRSYILFWDFSQV